MEAYLERVLLGTAINLGLLLPFLALAFLTTRKVAVKPVLWFAVFVLADIASVWLFKWMKIIPSWGGWNWQGKLLEVAWPVVLALILPAAFSAKSMGLTLPEAKRSWRVLLIACTLYAIVMALLSPALGAHFGVHGDLSTFLYEGTMPGLGEELMYRGLLLMLLNQAFGRPWRFAGIQFGWGFIIVTALFGFLHGIDAPSLGHVQIAWSGMIFPAATGLVLAWLRERTGSVWPGVLFHNFVNVFNQFLG